MKYAIAFDIVDDRKRYRAVKVLLEYGYRVQKSVFEAFVAAGLDPYIGFFHDVTYGRASLSLDLMEEFRHPLVDRLVLKLFNRTLLDDNDFETGETGQVYLKKESLKIFIRHYEEWANSVNRTYNNDGEMSWRKALWKQVEKLRSCIEHDAEYTPFSWKEHREAEPPSNTANTTVVEKEINAHNTA